MSRWWETVPGRREYELSALTAAGIPFEIDSRAEARGVLRLEARPRVDGRETPVIVTFPDHYPYFRFEIQASTVALDHHQNPFTGSLCLIGRATEQWNVGDTAAEFLTSRLPQTLHAGESHERDEVAGQEQHQAEPLSDYYSYLPSTMLVVDGSWNPDTKRGSFDAAVTADSTGRIRGAVLRLTDESGVTIAEADSKVARVFDESLRGRWVRSESAIIENDANIIREDAATIDPSLRRPQFVRVGSKRVDVLGVIFPEEVGWRDVGHGWLFVVSVMVPRR